MSKGTNDGKLGLGACVALLIGGMIGSAIFSLSGVTIYGAGPASILSWAIGALVMLVFGLVCAELASRYPKSGGVYEFPARTFGKVWGWLVCWGFINVSFCGIAFAAIYVGTYLSASFTFLGGTAWQVILALLTILFCFILNIFNISTTGKVNNIMVIGLAIACAIYVIVAFASGNWNGSYLTPFFTQGASGSVGFLAMVPTAILGYGNIVALAFMVTEIRNPNKTIPKAMYIGMGCTVLIYLLIILATLGLVTSEFLVANPGMTYIPMFAACFTVLHAYPWLAAVVSIAAVLALITTILVCVAMTGLSVKSAADDGILPAWFGKTSKRGQPVNAFAVLCIVSAVIAMFPQYTTTIVNLGAFFSVIVDIVLLICIIPARKKTTLPADGFKAPGGNILPIIVVAVLILCNVTTFITGSMWTWIFTFVWYFVGYLIYRASKGGKANKAA